MLAISKCSYVGSGVVYFNFFLTSNLQNGVNMPLDNKRICGPENTVPYILFTKLHTKSFQEELNEAIKPEGLRADRRELLQPRKIFLKTGVVSQAKGSAYLELGNTKVIVSVYDPREIPNKTEYSPTGELYCEFKFATFSCPQRRAHQQDAEEKQNSIILKQALMPAVCLHEFPNFQVDIYVIVLENDGSALSAAITCASTALAHAGIPMYDLVTSVTLGIVDDTHILDPNFNEERLCNVATYDDQKQFKDHGTIVMAILSTHKQVTQFYQTGNISMDNVSTSINSLTEACKEIVPLIERCIVRHVLNSVGKDVED